MLFPKYLTIILSAGFVTNVTKSGVVTGGNSADLHMIDLLSKELGFSYTVYSSRFRLNGDFLLGNFVLHERGYYKSSYPYDVSETTFATAKQDLVSNSLASLRPFRLPVWIVLLLSVTLVALAKFWIFRGRVQFLSVLFHASVALLGIHRNWKPKSNAQKILALTWSVAATFLTFAYVAVILAFLTVPVREKGITNFDELYEAITKGEATALKLYGSGIAEIMIDSGSEKLKFIGERMHKQETVSMGEGGNFLKIIKPNVAVIAPRAVLESMYGGDEYFVSPDAVLPSMSSLLGWTKDGFCCMGKINEAIHRIWGSGLFRKRLDDGKFQTMLYYKSVLQKMHSQDENTILPLTLFDISGAFYILLIGHILGVICFLCEIVSHSYC